MGLVEISPPAILPPRVVRLTRERARGEAEPRTAEHMPGSTEAALPLTPQRLELIKACAENALRSGESMTASRIAQRFAPRAAGAPPPGRRRIIAQTPAVALAAGMRRLTVLLILTTLLPNLTLGALWLGLWLGLVGPPWSKPVAGSTSVSALPTVEPTSPLPVLTAPEAIEATAGGVVTLPIALDGTDGIPAGSRILIKGLPPGAVLSSGHPFGERGWTLKPGDIGDLQLAIPETASSAAILNIELAAPDNRVVADASTLLKVLQAPAPVEEPLPYIAEQTLTGAQALEAEAVEEEMTAAIDAPPVLVLIDPDAPPLPERRPELPASDDGSADWVRPSAYVNLRQGPSSSASVVGVVAKGVKLRVMGRKRGWVQVSNPGTSESGWIYSANVAAAR